MRLPLSILGFLTTTVALVQVGAAQTVPNMTDFECRNALNEAFPGLRHASDNRLDVYSMVLKMETTESIGTRSKAYTTYLSYYDDLSTRGEIVQAEMLNCSKNITTGQETLLQRIAADGKRVWAFDVARNEYSVQYYSGEQEANRSQRYRDDFFNLFRTPVQGQPLDLVTLMNQVTGAVPRVRDWVGATTYKGFDNNDPLAPRRQIWQETPNGERSVRYYLMRQDGVWQIETIDLTRTTFIGSERRDINSTISVMFTNGLPVLMSRNEPRFFFTPPARSKVIASPRTVTF